MLIRCEGIVLRTHALGDTSRIAALFTREQGLLKLVAKGARQAPSRFGVALEPLTHGRYVVYHKPDRDLQLLSQADTLLAYGSEIADFTHLIHAQAAVELVDRLVWGEEPNEPLFELLSQALDSVRSAPDRSLLSITLAFALQIAALLGYHPRLDACAQCGGRLSTRRLFCADSGGLLCDRCAAPGAVISLSADALAALSLLLGRPLSEAAELVEVKRAGELLRVVEDFLRSHFQRFTGLKSLEVLRSLPGGVAGEVRTCA